MAAAAAEAPAAPAEQDAYIELWEAGEILATPLVKPEVPSPVGDAAGELGMAPLARALLKRFTPGELATFRAWACAGSQKTATICSGTDVVNHCNDEFSAALAEAASANLDFEQVFACECNEAKQDLLRKMHPKLKVLFSRSEDLSQDIAKDVISGNSVVVRSVHGVVAGFPCTDASRLNSHSRSSENMMCVSTKSKRTGKVFDDILKYMTVHKENLAWAILENVCALSSAPKAKGRGGRVIGPSNLDVCVYRLKAELGFAVVVLSLDPRMFGQPSSRSRLYMLCVKMQVLATAGMSLDEFTTLATETLKKLVGHAAAPLDSILLEESSAAVVSHLQSLMGASSSKRQKVQSEWGMRHSMAFDASGSAWWAPSAFRDSKARD